MELVKLLYKEVFKLKKWVCIENLCSDPQLQIWFFVLYLFNMVKVFNFIIGSFG